MISGFEFIKEGIRQRASAQIRQILSSAEEEAKKIIMSAEEEVKEAVIRISKPEVMIIRRKIIGSALMEGRRTIFNAREEVISRVLEEAKKRLSELATKRSSDYNNILIGLLKEAIKKIGEKEVIVNGNQKDTDYIKKNLSTITKRIGKELGYDVDIKVDDTPSNCIGGVIVYSKDRTKIFYNTIEGRLAKMYDELRYEVSKKLFGEDMYVKG
ncbi:MAG: V-type ATP synthase subunit E family protein [Nitrososphaerota archaeon]|nr:V-type proton ATPase subunit E [Nitrososphaerales archaeon]MDW8045154.1 V-type ATP synthase subunit E family protein [Nitrososphaerota archaeon]